MRRYHTSFNNCTTYITSLEESRSFQPHWLPRNTSSLNGTTSFERAWVYSSLGGLTWSHRERLLVYQGGGYSVMMGKSLQQSQDVVGQLRSHNWLDHSTAALFIVFTLFNSQTSLFSNVKIIIEASPIGTLQKTSTQINTIRVYDIGTGYDVILLVVQLVYPLFVIYYLVQQVNEMRKGLVAYFSIVFSWAECFQIGFAITWIFMHIFKMVQVDIISKQLNANILHDNDFEYVVMLNDIENILLALLIFLNTLKLLLRLKFGKVKHFFGVLRDALIDLLSYLFILAIGLFAFAHFGFLVFGRNEDSFHDLILILTTLSSMMIGNPFDFNDIQRSNRILGPGYYVTFGLVSTFIFVNFFILILIHYITRQAKKRRHVYGLGQFIIDRVKEACGFGKTVLPPQWTCMDEIKLQCHYAKLWIQTKVYRRIEYQHMLVKHCKPSLTDLTDQDSKAKRSCLHLCGLISSNEPDKPRHDVLFPEYLLDDVIEKQMNKLDRLITDDYVASFGEDLDASLIYMAVKTGQLKAKGPNSIPEVFNRYDG